MERRHISVEEYREAVAGPPASPAATHGKARLFALGRMPKGRMNKSEEAYLNDIVRPGMLAGTIQWWAFEAVKLMLAHKTGITIDFTLLRQDGLLELVDVKGGGHLIEDDARAKTKVAARMFPFVFSFAWRDKGRWVREEVQP